MNNDVYMAKTSKGMYRKFIAEAVRNIENNSKQDSKTKVVVISVIMVACILSLFGLAFWSIQASFLTLAILFVLAMLLAFFGDQIVFRRFCRIKNAHERFNIIEANEDMIRELYRNSALTYVAEPEAELLDFIYNWLAYEKVLKDERVDLYVFDGKKLKSALNKRGINDKARFMCIFNKDLDFNDSFARDHLYAGSRWLDDMC